MRTQFITLLVTCGANAAALLEAKEQVQYRSGICYPAHANHQKSAIYFNYRYINIIIYIYIYILYMGSSGNTVSPLEGLSRGYASEVCFGVCCGGMLRGLLRMNFITWNLLHI